MVTRQLCLTAILLAAVAAEADDKPADKSSKPQTPARGPRLVSMPDGNVEGWTIRPAALQTPILVDRDYMIGKLPKELVGGTLLLRGSLDSRGWLPPRKLTVSQDCTAFAVVMWKYNGEVKVSEAQFEKLAKEGWTAVDGGFETTTPPREVWRWKVLRKPIKKGEVNLAIDVVVNATVLFIFK